MGRRKGGDTELGSSWGLRLPPRPHRPRTHVWSSPPRRWVATHRLSRGAGSSSESETPSSASNLKTSPTRRTPARTRFSRDLNKNRALRRPAASASLVTCNLAPETYTSTSRRAGRGQTRPLRRGRAPLLRTLRRASQLPGPAACCPASRQRGGRRTCLSPDLQQRGHGSLRGGQGHVFLQGGLPLTVWAPEHSLSCILSTWETVRLLSSKPG